MKPIILVVTVFLLATAQFGQAQQESVLYSFGGTPNDGGAPRAAPILDASGNLYGTTEYGGTTNDGTVYMLTPSGQETILHNFGAPGDGTLPIGGVIFDASGNLYGTTEGGGAYNDGTVFKLTPSSSGWQETILLSFGGSAFGKSPYAGLVFDGAGNLYGTTMRGGAYGAGTVFELTASGQSIILHSFETENGDGKLPEAPVVFDSLGNLYGTTESGGKYVYQGTAFKLTPSGEYTTLHNFGKGGGGACPLAGLVLGTAGNLYGTALMGGAYDGGVVFEMAPSGQETVLHNFGVNDGDGSYPYAGVVFDASGNIYGTTEYGGANGQGTVFMLTPSGAETILYSFQGNSAEGSPFGGVVLGKKELYGTTFSGGTYNAGTVYKITR